MLFKKKSNRIVGCYEGAVCEGIKLNRDEALVDEI